MITVNFSFAQDEEQIKYFQMEPLDDSLFIKIQEALIIDPPDPKAEIIVDLRNVTDQTISIKGLLYPFLALPQDLRARIITYPFKLNLEEDITFTSVFTRIIQRIRFKKIIQPATRAQISSTLGYINPFIQLQGGERFGIALKQDAGISFGIGSPYSGPFETNMLEANFHILGMRIGMYTNIDALIETYSINNHNNFIVDKGFQINYVIPFGNFFEVGYFKTMSRINVRRLNTYFFPGRQTRVLNKDSTIRYQARVIDNKQAYYNWEFRYPVSILGSTRGKIYFAQYLDEWHFGFIFREISVAGSTFDLSFDGMPGSKYREPQYNINLLVQKIMEGWGSSAFAFGPSLSISKLSSGSFGFTKIFLNLRFKVGTSF